MDVNRTMSPVTTRRRQGKGCAGGFTVIELMVVLAVVGTIGFATIASTQAYLRKTSLQKAVYQITSELYNVKSRAIRTRQNCDVAFDKDNDNYTSSDPLANPTVELSDLRGNVTFVDDPEGIDAFSPGMQFDFRGLSTSAVAQQIYVQGTAADGTVIRTYRILLTRSGAISIRYFDVDNANWVK